MAVPPARDAATLTGPQDDQDSTDSTTGSATGGSAPRRGRAWHLPLLVVLLVAVLAAGGVLAWLLQGRSDSPADLQDQRDAVMSQAEQFALRAGTYGPDLLEGGTMPEYRERVLEVVTPDFGEEFVSQAALAEQIVADRGVQSTASVSALGVASMDQDSARVYVIAEFTSRVGEQGQATPLPLRLQVDLVRQGERWLVSNFDNVRSPDAPDPGVAPQPQQPQPTQPGPSTGSGGGAGQGGAGSGGGDQ